MTAATATSPQLLRRASWLSFGVGVVLLGIKGTAWWLTGSSAVLSDAVESVVHVVAVGFVVYSLRLSQKPPDEDHPYGHAKISFFSAGFEGMLISLAAVAIIWQAIHQWIAGVEPVAVKAGLILTGVALLVNGWLGWYLVKLGDRAGSFIIKANGKHVLTDAWTSVGVMAGLALTALTGWVGFDPLCAILLAIYILKSGFRLIQESAGGLMDRADPGVQAALATRLNALSAELGLSWHQMRHRHLGDGHWVDLHLVFADETTVRDAHAMATEVEQAIREELGSSTIVTTHLEPEDDHERIHGHPPGQADVSGLIAEGEHPPD